MNYFEPLEKSQTITHWSHIQIDVEEIVEFTISNVKYDARSFASLYKIYQFLEQNRNYITHILWLTNNYHSIIENEVFLKEQKQHNLSGFARRCSCYAATFGGKGDLIEEDTYHFVDNKQIKYEEFLRLQREEKLKRII